MKLSRSQLPQCLAAAIALALFSARLGAVAAESADLSHEVRFELGDAKFDQGDHITIQQVRGTSETITVGGTYSVEGTYTLASQDEADLALYATTVAAGGPTPIDAEQHIRIKKGTGTFRLVKAMSEDGYLHVSFYPVPFGSAFGGVYFGQGDRVFRRQTSFRNRLSRAQSSSGQVSLSGANQALIEYLGNPVESPANMDARYTREGLTNAVLLAAREARITVKKIAVDDSEYPFLVGVICGGSDAAKLKAQIRKMNGYEYGGSVGNDSNSDGSDTCNTFNMVPYRVYPREAAQQIDHRLMLRQQVFYNKLSAQE
jgi:hypothetical protein